MSETSRVAVVTGAARGIGRGIAERLVERGYAVLVTDVDGAAAEATAGEIGAALGSALDVRDRQGHLDLARVAAAHGTLTAWFNNAGVGDVGTLRELDPDQIDRLVDVNLKGVLWGTRAALDGFGPRGGDVVNTASLSGLGPVPGLGVYAATKAAVVSLSMSVAAEAPSGVRVHALCPDGVATRMVDEMPDESLAKALVHSGGRILTVDEVADAALALLGSSRVVRTLPGWRGALMRSTSVAPSLAARGAGLFAAQGRRAMRRGRAGT
ncbi:SDR family oxidoreductase [Nocardioides donggukensis]|uniref:SDR family oxidoreductase n=1 Tax=Nocardioides donggukensis TaxID=2774019 RepID=A0A927KAG7_9ACTN|nr:SDR family oxidoreductase [Nocardioides donggukensis]MBD8870625.1 SDR family oxidoreductase [Nocardioides donggukensis]